MTATVENRNRKDRMRLATISNDVAVSARYLKNTAKIILFKFLRIQISMVLVLIATVTGAENLQRSSSATLVIGGVVPPQVQLTVTPQPGNSQLNLASGETDVTVATVNEKCNSAKGYTVTITSQNATAGSEGVSFMRGINNRNNQIVYNLKYGLPGQEEEVRLKNGTAVLAKEDKRTGEAGLNKLLKVTVLPATGAAPDTYQDVLTLTLTSK